MATATIPRSKAGVDGLLLNAVLMLIAVGVVAVFDSSYARSADVASDPFQFLRRQAVWAGVGLVTMGLVMKFGYWRLRQLAVPMLVMAVVLLLLVWCPGLGKRANNAYRWVGWGPFQVQPSEFAKLALMVYLSALLSRKTFDIRNLREGLVAALAVIALVCILVEAEPDLGTACVIGLASLTLLAIAGARPRHIAGVAGLAAVLFIAMSLRHGYRQDRFRVWWQPEKYKSGPGYQVYQGLVAVGSGGPHGVGLGAGRGKFFLPEANTDYIFATIAEETGLLGSLLVLGLMGVVGWRAFLIAKRTQDDFGMLLATGIGAIITWQALINVAVVTNSVPATGVPLPFISYGGSSLVFLLTSVGVLLNIARHPGAGARG